MSALLYYCLGPATVRMVSNSGPPMPMPMQVPPGHMVQQIVDENGILTHVILSPQPPGIPAGPPMMVGYYVCIEILLTYVIVVKLRLPLVVLHASLEYRICKSKQRLALYIHFARLVLYVSLVAPLAQFCHET